MKNKNTHFLVPSLVRASGDLKEKIQIINAINFRRVHVDLVFGETTQTLIEGKEFYNKIRSTLNNSVDFHIFEMRKNFHFTDYLKLSPIKNDCFIFHIFNHTIPSRALLILLKMKKKGFNVGVALDVDISVENIFNYINVVDTILIMGIPMGGKKLQLNKEALVKLAKIRKRLRYQKKNNVLIGIDGGVNRKTFKVLAKMFDYIIVGSYLLEDSNHLRKKIILEDLLRGISTSLCSQRKINNIIQNSITKGVKLVIQEVEKKVDSLKPALICVTGPVASGKTHFTEHLMDSIKKKLNLNIEHIQLDYWVNEGSVNKYKYSERFFLKEFELCITDMSQERLWMLPRRDLKNIEHYLLQVSHSSKTIEWHGRNFVELNLEAQYNSIAQPIYVELSSKRFFSPMFPKKRSVYLIEGTLSALSSLKNIYIAKVYVSANWTNRVARMIQRYRAKKVMGSNPISESEYVLFLIKEACTCADKEIESQISNDMIFVDSKTNKISELFYLFILWKQARNNIKIMKKYHITINGIYRLLRETFTNYFLTKINV